MLPVYICDDNERMRTELSEEIERQILIREYDMKLVLSTDCPEEIIEKVEKNRERGIYFLDVDLKLEKMDGFSLGKMLRELDFGGYIVYVTSHADLAYKTFEYHLEAMDYITKGNQLEMIASVRRCLSSIVEKISKETEQPCGQMFTIRDHKKVKMVPIKDILFFETSSKKHHIILYTQCERIEFSGNMKELEGRLTEGFLRTHRSYLVQTCKIREIDLKRLEIILINGQSCYIARNKKKEIEKYTKRVSD